jgi:hypothetical protein
MRDVPPEEIDQLSTATDQIVAQAIEEIRTMYQRERYHNVEHSTFVHTEAMILAEALPLEYKLTQKERALLMIVSATHDVRYDHNPRVATYNGENEKEAAAWVAEQMRAHPETFDANDIDTAVYAILATRARPHPARTSTGWEPTTTIQQNVGESGKPPLHIVAQLLCDADLAGLGSPWETQQDTMTGYYLELNPEGGTLETWREYLHLQQLLLQNRSYFTAVAQGRYGPHTLENMAKIQTILRNPSDLEQTYKKMLNRAAQNRKRT